MDLGIKAIDYSTFITMNKWQPIDLYVKKIDDTLK
jgi:hypothetical protein